LRVFASFCEFLRVFTRFYEFLRVFTSFYEFSRIFTSFHKFSRVFTSFHEFSRIFTSFHEFSRVFTSFHEFSRVFMSVRVFERVFFTFFTFCLTRARDSWRWPCLYIFSLKTLFFQNYFHRFFSNLFCLDEISFRRDYKSCRIGVVVVVVVRSFVVPQLWELCDGITFVILELHFWDLVHCLLISFCFGSEILKKIGPPQPPKKPKKPQKKTYGFSRWDILPML